MTGFALRVSDILAERGMNRADLARLTGIPYHRLNPWFIREAAKPNAADVLSVARHLGVSARYLVNGGDREPFWEGQTPEEQEIARLVSLLPDQLRHQLLGFAKALAADPDQARSADEIEDQ